MVELIQPSSTEWPAILRNNHYGAYRVAVGALPGRRLLEQYLLGVSDAGLGYRYGVPFLIVDRRTATVVGNIGGKGMVEGEDDVELGYQTAPEYHNRGIMTSAIGHLQQLATGDGIGLIAHVEPENLASRRVLEKCGFTFDALVRLPDSLDLERWSWSPD